MKNQAKNEKKLADLQSQHDSVKEWIDTKSWQVGAEILQIEIEKRFRLVRRINILKKKMAAEQA